MAAPCSSIADSSRRACRARSCRQPPCPTEKSSCAVGSTSPPPATSSSATIRAIGPVSQHLDPRRYAEATGLPVLPIVIETTAPTAGDAALVRDWTAPDIGIERHRIYMVQWYAFAAMALGLWLWFAVRPRDPRG